MLVGKKVIWQVEFIFHVGLAQSMWYDDCGGAAKNHIEQRAAPAVSGGTPTLVAELGKKGNTPRTDPVIVNGRGFLTACAPIAHAH